MIEELSVTDVQTLYKSIHFPETNQKFFDVPLYCKAIQNMTPKKTETTVNDEKNDGITSEEVVKNTNISVPRPQIPGLPEEERTKKRRKRKKKSKNKEGEELSISCPRNDLLISPQSGKLKECDNIDRDFDFSDCDNNDDSGGDVTSDAFEEEDFPTVSNLMIKFEGNHFAKSTTKPATITKRSAGSPLDKETKKSRAQLQSELPKNNLE